MDNEDIKELLGKIGVIYVTKYFATQEEFAINKDEKTNTLLLIYQRVYKMLENVSVSLDKKEFIEVGKELREKQNDVNIDEIFKDFGVINALLKCADKD